MRHADYVPVEMAARASGMHAKSITRLLRQGKLVGHKASVHGHLRWMVSPASLHDYLQQVQTFASDRPGPRMFLKKDEG